MPKELSISEKLKVVDEAVETGNIKQHGAKWKFYSSTIRKWREDYKNTEAEASASMSN